MFKFELGQKVTENVTKNTATIIGRVEYMYSENAYMVRWQGNDDAPHEEWWNERQIEGVEE